MLVAHRRAKSSELCLWVQDGVLGRLPSKREEDDSCCLVMASRTLSSSPISFPSKTHSLTLLSWKTLPLHSSARLFLLSFPHNLPSKSRLLPRASLAPLDKVWASSSGIWKCQLETAGKGHTALSTNWSQQLLEGTGLSLQLGCTGHDVVCTTVIFASSFMWIRLFDILVQHNLLEQKLSRKLMHISTGILYALAWPLYSKSPWSRFFALAIPLANVLKLLLYGLGILKDEGLVKSISREGSPLELLRGPLYYVLVLSLSTVMFWRDSPVGMISLAIMCGGDGIADVVGRRIGGIKLPYNPKKSWAGSTAMLVFGFLLSIGFLYYYSFLGFFQVDWGKAIQNVALISFAATLVESLPISTKIDDNLSVPLTTVLLGVTLFGTNL